MGDGWHTLDIKALEGELGTDLCDGLSIREARSRLEKEKKRDGGERYSLFVGKKGSTLRAMICFLMTPAMLLLVVTSILAAIFGEVLCGLAVLALTLGGAAVGGFISLKAQKMIESMRDYASPTVRVRRGGNMFYTDGRNAVQGDILILSQGDLLPCDARIISADGLSVKELINTKSGIRNRVVTKVAETEGDSVTSPDASNMLYAGSAILEGEAVAVVVATGAHTYLAKFAEQGELGGIEDEHEGVKVFKPTLHRITLICFSALVILSLISIVTLRGSASFVGNFLMLLSAPAMISLELVGVGASNSVALAMERASRISRSKKKKDASAAVRSVKAIDTLTGVTDLVLLGRVALFDGAYRISSAFTASGATDGPTPETSVGNSLLMYIHTYIKALRESGAQNDLVKDGIYDALSEHLRSVDFDVSGASLVIRSLYFAGGSENGIGYACAETANDEYRVAVTLDREILSVCGSMRSGDGVGVETLKDKIGRLKSFIDGVEADGGKCLYVVSQRENYAVLEGVIALSESPARELAEEKERLCAMGVGTTLMMSCDETEAERLVSMPAFSSLFDREIAYASEFRRAGREITDGAGNYCAYFGFDAKEYAELISFMRKSGATVAAYGLDNGYLDVMARADIAISCDVMRYSSEKYKESVYERLLPCGRDTNLRCSQQTRLLARVMIHRTHQGGGGLTAVRSAIKAARSACISHSLSVLLFAMLMSSFLPTVAMSVIVGGYFLSAVQTVALAVVGAIISMIAFADSEPKQDIVNSRMNFTRYPADVLKSRVPGMIARAAVSTVAAVTLKVLDAVGIFGESAAYEMPVFVCLLLTLFAELFLINREYTVGGEGRRRCWSRVIAAYAVLLAVGALITQDAFASRLLVRGVGVYEFIIVPAYCLLYALAVIVAGVIERSGK